MLVGLFQRNVMSSGVIPQLSLIMGPCAGIVTSRHSTLVIYHVMTSRSRRISKVLW